MNTGFYAPIWTQKNRRCPQLGIYRKNLATQPSQEMSLRGACFYPEGHSCDEAVPKTVGEIASSGKTLLAKTYLVVTKNTNPT